jgi:site-specific DNA-methyltransferase (adenine-specific)
MKQTINLLHGDCLEQMKALEDNSVDAIVSDPPYGISFMANKWDYDVPSVEVWKEALRVLKAGGHALIACGTRTQHRMVVNIEDAGFEIRDVVSWIYGSGFPKSLNIHKKDERCPKGWGTALKPACEFFTLCRKPLSEKTVAANVLKWGTGGINIDGCRVGTEEIKTQAKKKGSSFTSVGSAQGFNGCPESTHTGRFPANLIHDGSQEVLDGFPETKSSVGKKQTPSKSKRFRGLCTGTDKIVGHNDQGSAARFFYCAKASKKDRDEGLDGFEEKRTTFADGTGLSKNGDGTPRNQKPSNRNNHPTVKPTALMAYLCKLITPPDGVVLDPYMGSGSTGKAAVREGFSFIGCELDKDYFQIATARIKNEELSK